MKMLETSSTTEDYIKEELKDAQKRYEKVQNELSLASKEFIDYENHSVAAKARESDYLHEIDLLKLKESSEEKDLEFKIEQLKLHIAEDISTECTSLDDEVAKYQLELNALEVCDIGGMFNETVEEEYLDEFLVDHKDNILLDIDQKVQERGAVQMQLDNLKINVSTITTEIDKLKQKCTNASAEIDEAESVLQNLEEELMLGKNQLITVNPILNQVDDDNSLFSEVNDRRVELRKTLEELKTKCSEVKNELGLTQKHMSNIKLLNEEMSNYKKVYMDEQVKYVQMLRDTYVSRLRILGYIYKQYKEDIVQKQNLIRDGLPSSLEDFLSCLMNAKLQICAEIEKENGTQFRAHKMLHLQVKEVQSKIDEVKLISNQLQPKLVELTTKLDVMKKQAAATIPLVNEIKTAEKPLESQNKSKPEVRRVAFTEDTIENKPNRIKRGAKTCQLKSVCISTLLKKKS